MKPLKGMRTCAHPGCRAQVMKHDKCEHHRPRPSREPETEAEAEARREKNRASAKARKTKLTLPGIPAGWEV